MWGSATIYIGAIAAAAGLVFLVRPVPRLRVGTRLVGLAIGLAGAALVTIALSLPVSESRVSHATTRLDEFVPAWQFREIHTLRVRASPPQVFQALRLVRADEILLYRTLTWIRRGGRQAPRSILNPGTEDALIDVATRSGFVVLAEDAPRELVIGAVVMAPPGPRGPMTPEIFRRPLPPGFALAAMNFAVRPEGSDASWVSTETRVFASDAAGRQRFARYWRVIYPGSVIIRRMWLRAIRERAESPG